MPGLVEVRPPGHPLAQQLKQVVIDGGPDRFKEVQGEAVAILLVAVGDAETRVETHGVEGGAAFGFGVAGSARAARVVEQGRAVAEVGPVVGHLGGVAGGEPAGHVADPGSEGRVGGGGFGGDTLSHGLGGGEVVAQSPDASWDGLGAQVLVTSACPLSLTLRALSTSTALLQQPNRRRTSARQRRGSLDLAAQRPVKAATSLAQHRMSDEDLTATPQANARRSAALSVRKREQPAWERNDQPRQPVDDYATKILPGLRDVPLAAVQLATGLSISAASRIRSGKLQPHVRHWAALGQLFNP